MGFFDSLTKAVSDTVDRGKKEVDQFMRIQKVKGEIGQVEQAIRDASARGQQVRQEIGDRVIARLREGTLADAELQSHADRAAAIEKEVAAHQAVIAEKREQIARIEAEGQSSASTSAPPPLVAQASPPAIPAVAEATAGKPDGASAAAGRPASVPVAATVPPPLPVAPASVPVAPASVPAIPSVATTCSQCGAVIAASAAFCTECGAKLA